MEDIVWIEPRFVEFVINNNNGF